MHTGFPIVFRASLYEQTAKDLQTSEESFQRAKEQPEKHQTPSGAGVGGRAWVDYLISQCIGVKKKKTLLKFL